MVDVVCALDAKALLGEGPLWDVTDQALYWVDIKRHEIHRFDPVTGEDRKWTTPEDVGSLAVRDDGNLVIAMTSGFYYFDLDTGKARPLCNPEPDLPDNRFNDGKPDRQGRFWAGSMHDPETEATGSLYRLDADHSCHRMVEGIICSNSLCWSPDDRVLYYADSFQRTIWAWDYDPVSGEIDNRRDFIKFPDDDGVPDGATVDVDGFIWVAVWNGWRLDRYDPTGRLVSQVELPTQCPTCPAFGGAELNVIYITSATIKIDERSKQPQAGGIFAVDAGVRGLPDVRYKG